MTSTPKVHRLLSDRVPQIMLAVLIVMMVPVVGLVALILFEPEPYYYPRLPLVLTPAAVHVGESVTYIVERCATDPFAPSPLSYHTDRALISADDASTQYPQGGNTRQAPPGCTTYPITFVIPTIPPGRYYYAGTTTATGRIRQVQQPWRTTEVIVLP